MSEQERALSAAFAEEEAARRSAAEADPSGPEGTMAAVREALPIRRIREVGRGTSWTLGLNSVRFQILIVKKD